MSSNELNADMLSSEARLSNCANQNEIQGNESVIKNQEKIQGANVNCLHMKPNNDILDNVSVQQVSDDVILNLKNEGFRKGHTSFQEAFRGCFGPRLTHRTLSWSVLTRCSGWNGILQHGMMQCTKIGLTGEIDNGQHQELAQQRSKLISL